MCQDRLDTTVSAAKMVFLDTFTYTALVPHRNVLNEMLCEQNVILKAAAFSGRVFRFMPLAVFLDEDFESAQKIFSADTSSGRVGKRTHPPIIVLPPVVSHNAVVHPVSLDFKIAPVFPRFVASPSREITRAFSGIVTAFSFDEISPDAGHPGFFSGADFKEHGITVFRLCQIDFFCENRAWKWSVVREKWIKP
jgi:hypothetical protein